MNCISLELNTENSNLLNLDALKDITKDCISAKPDTSQAYSFNGAVGVSDQLPMKQKKGSKGISNVPFFSTKKITKPKCYSAYSDEIQVAVTGSNHTVATADNRTLHSKHISKPISELTQEPNNRRPGLRGPDGRFIKSPRITNIQDSKSDLGDASLATPTVSTSNNGKQQLLHKEVEK